jgi:hypothetical protein
MHFAIGCCGHGLGRRHFLLLAGSAGLLAAGTGLLALDSSLQPLG